MWTLLYIYFVNHFENLSMFAYFMVLKCQGFCLRTYMNQLREAPFRCIIELEHQCMSNYM